MEKVKKQKKEPKHFRQKLTLGLLTIALMVAACGGVSPPTPDITSPTAQAAEVYTGEHAFKTVQLVSMEQAAGGVVERVTYGFDDLTVEFDSSGAVRNIVPPNYLSQRSCAADPLMISAAQERAIPYSTEDIRNTICGKYEMVAKQISLPDDQIIQFVNTMAQKTIVLEQADLEQVCQIDTGGCVNRGNIFLSIDNLNSLPHETVHYFTEKVPEGAYYLPENNVCLIYSGGIISLVFVDNTTGINWQDFLSVELLSVLRDIRESPMGVSNYTPDPNAQVTQSLQKIAYEMDDPLKMLIPPETFQPTLADLAAILEDIISKNDIQELLNANRLLAVTIDQLRSRYSNNPLHESQLSPVQACQ